MSVGEVQSRSHVFVPAPVIGPGLAPGTSTGKADAKDKLVPGPL
jgi:hypothetical protein